jgi:hypothetical protein
MAPARCSREPVSEGRTADLWEGAEALLPHAHLRSLRRAWDAAAAPEASTRAAKDRL